MLVNGGCTGVRDFRGNGVLLLVDVVLYLRLFGGAGQRIDQAGAEVFWQHNRRVVVAGLHALYGLLFVAHKPPAELVVMFELYDHLLAGIEMANQIIGGAAVLIGDGDLQVAGGGIRIPVGKDVEPCIQGRQYCDT